MTLHRFLAAFNGFLLGTFDFRGHSGRLEFVTASGVIVVGTALVSGFGERFANALALDPWDIYTAWVLIFLALLLPLLACWTRRIRAAGYSPNWMFLLLGTPFIVPVLPLVVMALQPSVVPIAARIRDSLVVPERLAPNPEPSPNKQQIMDAPVETGPAAESSFPPPSTRPTAAPTGSAAAQEPPSSSADKQNATPIGSAEEAERPSANNQFADSKVVDGHKSISDTATAAHKAGSPGFVKRWRLSRHRHRAFKSASEAQAALERYAAWAQVTVDGIDAVDLSDLSEKNEVEILRISDCSLIEVRKGARVSERSGSSSGRSYGGVRVGPVGVGGSSGSSYSSTTVSHPAPDIMKEIDSGTLIITSRRISFAGAMFARNAEFKKIADFRTSNNIIRIAPRVGAKSWGIVLPSTAQIPACRALLTAGTEHPQGRLDADLRGAEQDLGHLEALLGAELTFAAQDFYQLVVHRDVHIDEVRSLDVQLGGSTVNDVDFPIPILPAKLQDIPPPPVEVMQLWREGYK